MDPEANMAAQIETALEIQGLFDNCQDDGTFSRKQEEEIMDLANTLAGLVLAMDHWRSMQG